MNYTNFTKQFAHETKVGTSVDY